MSLLGLNMIFQLNLFCCWYAPVHSVSLVFATKTFIPVKSFSLHEITGFYMNYKNNKPQDTFIWLIGLNNSSVFQIAEVTIDILVYLIFKHFNN